MMRCPEQNVSLSQNSLLAATIIGMISCPCMDSIYWWQIEIEFRENRVDHGGLDDVSSLPPGRTCLTFIDSSMTNVGTLFVLCCFVGSRSARARAQREEMLTLILLVELREPASSRNSLRLTESSNCPPLTLWSSALQLFHVAYVLIKFANSPRPDLWVLERSVDNGRTFTPWQYFAREFTVVTMQLCRDVVNVRVSWKICGWEVFMASLADCRVILWLLIIALSLVLRHVKMKQLPEMDWNK